VRVAEGRGEDVARAAGLDVAVAAGVAVAVWVGATVTNGVGLAVGEGVGSPVGSSELGFAVGCADGEAPSSRLATTRATAAVPHRAAESRKAATTSARPRDVREPTVLPLPADQYAWLSRLPQVAAP
jgi:hypothetical protein